MNLKNDKTVITHSAALIEAASISLYRDNAFKLLGLPVNAAYRTIERKAKEIRLKNRIENKQSSGQTQSELNSNIVNTLNDPERRLVEELFWFWDGNEELTRKLNPQDIDGFNDVFFDVSSICEADKDMTYEQKHDLAIFFHMYALELEHISLAVGLSGEHAEKCLESWKRSYSFWNELLIDDRFWSYINQRIKDLGDPRLKTGASHRIRKSFPTALLKINAQLALKYILSNKTNYKNHVSMIHNSGFDKATIDDVLNNAIEPFRHRIKLACNRLSTIDNTQIDHGNLVTWELLLELKPSLVVIDKMLCSDSLIRELIYNSVAESIRDFIIDYGNTTKDWAECAALLSQVYNLAMSPALRQKVHVDIEAASSNAEFEKRHNQHSRAIQERKKTVSYLTYLIQHKCNTAKQASSTTPENADKYTWSFILQVKEPLQELNRIADNPSDFDIIKEEVVKVILLCQSYFYERTKNKDECRMLLLTAYDYAVTPYLRSLVDQGLKVINTVSKDTKDVPDSDYAESEDLNAVPNLERHDGSQVFVVSLMGDKIIYPPMCACCLVEDEVKLEVRPCAADDYRVFHFPLCIKCNKHQKELVLKRRLFSLIIIIFSNIVMYIIGVNNERIEYLVFIIQGFIVSGVIFVLLLPLFRLTKIGKDHVSMSAPVTAESSGGKSRLKFKFWNPLYAKIFARLNSSNVEALGSNKRQTDKSLLFGRMFLRRAFIFLLCIIGIHSVTYFVLYEKHWEPKPSSITANNRVQLPSQFQKRSANSDTGGDRRTTNVPVRPPMLQSQSKQPVESRASARSRLSAEIEAMRREINAIEIELNRIDTSLATLSSNISSLKKTISRYEVMGFGASVNESLYNQAIDQHNDYVNQHNKLLERRNIRYRQYETKIQEVNNTIRRYNQMR